MPHSSYSPVVSGIESSNIVVTTSTNGTEAIIPLNNSGDLFSISGESLGNSVQPKFDGAADGGLLSITALSNGVFEKPYSNGTADALLQNIIGESLGNSVQPSFDGIAEGSLFAINAEAYMYTVIIPRDAIRFAVSMKTVRDAEVLITTQLRNKVEL